MRMVPVPRCLPTDRAGTLNARYARNDPSVPGTILAQTHYRARRHHMTDTRAPRPRSGLVTGSRWILTILAALFTLGAFTQFFLVGMGMFEDGSRWQDHANL